MSTHRNFEQARSPRLSVVVVAGAVFAVAAVGFLTVGQNTVQATHPPVAEPTVLASTAAAPLCVEAACRSLLEHDDFVWALSH